jgi:hypothetical protein
VRTLAKLLSGATDPDSAAETGDLRLEGPRPALARFISLFAYQPAI